MPRPVLTIKNVSPVGRATRFSSPVPPATILGPIEYESFRLVERLGCRLSVMKVFRFRLSRALRATILESIAIVIMQFALGSNASKRTGQGSIGACTSVRAALAASEV